MLPPLIKCIGSPLFFEGRGDFHQEFAVIERTDARKLTVAVLKEHHRRAVQLRLSGLKASDVAALAELAPGTVIAAVKAYRDGDGFELSCDKGERVRVAFAMDCCDREVMGWVATTKGIDAGLVGELMMQAVEHRFGISNTVPNEIEWLSDNGSCYTAVQARFFARQLGLKPMSTPVSSLQSNGMAESFAKTIKRDYASLALRPDAKTVMQQLPQWFERYNTKHPHSALKYLPPRLFREKQTLND